MSWLQTDEGEAINLEHVIGLLVQTYIPKPMNPSAETPTHVFMAVTLASQWRIASGSEQDIRALRDLIIDRIAAGDFVIRVTDLFAAVWAAPKAEPPLGDPDGGRRGD